MTSTIKKHRPGWNAAQWASIPRDQAADAPARWTLWHWASTERGAGGPIYERGDSALSGGGHNSSGQRWAAGYRRPA